MFESNPSTTSFKRKTEALGSPDEHVPVVNPQQRQSVEQPTQPQQHQAVEQSTQPQQPEIINWPVQPQSTPRRPFDLRRAEELDRTLQLCQDEQLSVCFSCNEATYNRVFVTRDVHASKFFTLEALVASAMNILVNLIKIIELPEWLEEMFYTDPIITTKTGPPKFPSAISFSLLDSLRKETTALYHTLHADRVGAYVALQRIFKAAATGLPKPVFDESTSSARTNGRVAPR